MGNPSFEPRKSAGKALYRWIFVAAALIVAGGAAFVIAYRPAPRTPAEHDLDRTVAVLPFENASGDAAQDYLSDGIAANLIGSLTRVHDLKVIGRNSSFQFRHGRVDWQAIGAKLGATCLLEGSAQRKDGRIRIDARLITAADGRTLWSEKYDRESKDIFAVQAQIARAVATSLHATAPADDALTPARPPGDDAVAYDQLLQGDFQFRLATEDGYRHAIAHYDQAIQRSPKYAAAFAVRALAWENLGAEHLGGDALKEAFAHAEESARAALELDASQVPAHIALGLVLQDAKSDFAAAEAEF
ncbi:MAG TPA: hypothetical protein VF132_11070, partial [Rudaea sp.]